MARENKIMSFPTKRSNILKKIVGEMEPEDPMVSENPKGRIFADIQINNSV